MGKLIYRLDFKLQIYWIKLQGINKIYMKTVSFQAKVHTLTKLLQKIQTIIKYQHHIWYKNTEYNALKQPQYIITSWQASQNHSYILSNILVSVSLHFTTRAFKT